MDKDLDAHVTYEVDKQWDEAYKIDQLDKAFLEKTNNAFQRYLLVRDRLPELLDWVEKRLSANVERKIRNLPEIEDREKVRDICAVIRNIDNWMEWIFFGRCEVFRTLPEGLIPVQPTFLDDKAIELYGGKGYSLEGKPGAAALWLEACAMADSLHGD